MLDIRGLRVPVDDAFFVRLFERRGNVFRDGTRLINRERPACQMFPSELSYDGDDSVDTGSKNRADIGAHRIGCVE